MISVAAMAIAPAAAAAKTGSIYDVTKATGYERVTFDGTQNSGCEIYDTCGYTGTVKYALSGKPAGKLVLTRSKSGKVRSTAHYRTHGVTTVRVNPPDGSGAWSGWASGFGGGPRRLRWRWRWCCWPL